MNTADIPKWIAEQRAVAQLQRQRWEGVDPSRLLEALDLIEQLLGRPSQAAGVPIVVTEFRYTPSSTWPLHAAFMVQITGTINAKDALTLDEQANLLHKLGHMNVMLISPRD